jgi:hypothetical protein
MIGLSLAHCVRDIVTGKVAFADVDVIYAGTHAVTEEDWEEVMSGYLAAAWWREYPNAARSVVALLRESGRIIQPRVNGHKAFNISRGHWLDARRYAQLLSIEGTAEHVAQEICVGEPLPMYALACLHDALQGEGFEY